MTSLPQTVRAPREQGFWVPLDGLQTKVDASELRHLALGLAFFRYLSEAFSERRAWLERESRNPRSIYFCVHEGQRRAMLERPESYRSAKVLWVPAAARWERILAAVQHPHLGRAIDAAIISLELENPGLAGLLPRDYARPELGREALARMLESVCRIGAGEGSSAPALSALCEGFAPSAVVPALALAPPPPRRAAPPFNSVIERLDLQLRELDRQIEQSQALRARNGRA